MKKTLLPAFLLAVFTSTAQVTQTFSYTGSVQTYVVPSCADSIVVDISGAEGSTDAGSQGTPGKGGRVQARINVNPGDIIYVYVGGQGTAPTGGFNGGGNGGSGGPTSPGGGGGGASDLRLNSNLLANRIVVAGGGGGCGGYNGVNGGDGGG